MNHLVYNDEIKSYDLHTIHPKTIEDKYFYKFYVQKEQITTDPRLGSLGLYEKNFF